MLEGIEYGRNELGPISHHFNPIRKSKALKVSRRYLILKAQVVTGFCIEFFLYSFGGRGESKCFDLSLAQLRSGE